MPGDLRNNAWVAPTPTPDPIDNLANAIVLKAVDDYKLALKTLRKYPKSGASMHEIRSIERFFASDWCKVLTSVDMVAVAKQIRKTILGDQREENDNGNQET